MCLTKTLLKLKRASKNTDKVKVVRRLFVYINIYICFSLAARKIPVEQRFCLFLRWFIGDEMRTLSTARHFFVHPLSSLSWHTPHDRKNLSAGSDTASSKLRQRTVSGSGNGYEQHLRGGQRDVRHKPRPNGNTLILL